jgi:hypothetical protein
MSCTVYNPYQSIGIQFEKGMDYVINNISKPDAPEITFDQLNRVLLDYLASVLSSEPNVKPLTEGTLIGNNLASGILANSANSYQYSKLGDNSFYNLQQIFLINAIIRTIKRNDSQGIIAVLDDANTRIVESNLGIVDQTPLLIAVEIGKACCNYWTDAIYNVKSLWAPYLNANVAINISSLQFWVIASMEGALNGFAQIQQFNMGAASMVNTLGRSNAEVAAMISAVGVSSGKLFFNWIKKIQDDNLRLGNVSWGGGPAAIKKTRQQDGGKDQFSGRLGADNCDYRARERGGKWSDWTGC